jgi:hypothetical protein
VLDQPPTRLDEALLETGERPGVDSRRQHQPPPEIPELVPWRESRKCSVRIASSPRRSSISRTSTKPASEVTRDP